MLIIARNVGENIEMRRKKTNHITSKGKKMKTLKTLNLILTIILLSINYTYAGIGDYEKHKIFASDGANYTYFGSQGSVAIDGDYAVVGSYFADVNGINNAGAAYIYFWNGTNWVEQAKIYASNLAEEQHFGKSVAINGDRVVVGATGTYSTNSLGQAYVFKRNGTNWVEEVILTASDGVNRDAFGTDVEIINDELIISANDQYSYKGAVYYFKFNGSTWVETQIISPTSSAGYKQFGKSLVFDESNLLVGCIDDSYSGFRMPGAVYAFAKEGGIWVQKSRILPDDNTIRVSFGTSVVLQNEVAVISDVDSTPEKVYIFNKTDDTTWVQIDTLKSGSITHDMFGYDLGIDGEYILIGSNENGEAAYEAGSVFVYKNNGSSWLFDENILPQGSESMGAFGNGIACKDGRIIIGASLTTGFTSESGAAFIYMEPQLTGEIASTTTGGDWKNTATWIGGVIPKVSDNVIINGFVNVDKDYFSECNNLTINESKDLYATDMGWYGILVNVIGDLTNNGQISQSRYDGYDMNISIGGNATNNGNWKNNWVIFGGTSDQTLTNNSSLECGFKFVANVTNATSFQWYKNGTIIDGANSDSYLYYIPSNYTEWNPDGEYYCVTNLGNSRKMTIIGVTPVSGGEILVENFDGTQFPPNGWSQTIVNSSNTWKSGNPAENSFNFVDGTNVNSAICPWVAADQNEWLKTPILSFPNDAISMEFYAGYSTSWLNAATLKLNISTDGGSNWTKIWEAENDGNGWQWRKISIDLSSYSNSSNVVLGWQYVGNDGDLAGIDNIKITYGTVDIKADNLTQIPSDFSLSQNYPNPFNPTTVISYQIPEKSFVNLKVYDILGNEVMTLVNGQKQAGSYQINFDASNLSSGVYIYQIIADNFVKSKKMLLLK